MKSVLLICLLLFAFDTSLYSQVKFEELPLEEIDSQKPIFVDVYTTWCGPCKKMDRTTFQDQKVSKVLNENFTCLKWDAEHVRFKHLADQYEVTSYPTFLFLSADHKVVSRQIGFMQSGDLIETASTVIDFIESDPFDDIEISTLNLDESIDLLNKVSEMDSPKKTPLVKQVIENLGENDRLWKKHAELLSLSITKDIELEYIEKLLEFHKPLFSINFKALTKHGRIQRKFKSILEFHLKNAKKSADYPLHQRISQLKGKVAEASRPNLPPDFVYKQIQTDRLEYYRFNKVKENYRPLADSLVERFILPNDPADVAEYDKNLSRSTRKMEKMLTLETEEIEIDSSALDFYKDSHSNSLKLASRLDEIANAYMLIYDDQESLEKALEYSMFSYEYLQLPKNLITRAKIQFELGNSMGAIETLKDARANEFYSVREIQIEDLLIRFGG